MIPRSFLRQSSRAVSGAIRASSAATPRTTPFRAQGFNVQTAFARPGLASQSNGVMGRRWASTESKDEAAKKEAEKKEGESKEESKEDKLQKEIEAKNKEIIGLKDKYLRSVADFQNLQMRAQRDIENAKQFGIQKFAGDLLDSIDNLDRALGAVPKDKLKPTEDGRHKELIELHSGLKMTERVLFAALKKHGLERYDPSEEVEGKPQRFDANLHEATFQAPAPGKQDGDVMYTQSKGFLLNGRVLRAAKVGVVKNPQ